MDFGSINWIAVLVATVLGFVFGAVYYGVLSKPWMAAGRIAPEQARPGIGILAVTFGAELVMATILAGLIIGLGNTTVIGGAVTGLLVWMGFMLTTMAINHRYQAYGWDLTAIDGGHYLGVAVIMGLVIGWFG